MCFQFLLDLLKGEIAAVDPPLSLPQQPVDCFNWVNLSVGIRQVFHIVTFFVDPHA